MVLKRKTHLQAIIGLLTFLGTLGSLRAEGSREIGSTVGLSQSTVVYVNIDEPSERLLFCSSDDGVQAQPIQGQALDLNPGNAVDKDSLRDGADIIIYPPVDMPCQGPGDCNLRQICFNRTLELPFEFGPSDGGDTFCGYAYRVSPTADPTAGLCDAQTLEPNHFELETTQTGAWRFDFVGEQSTTGPAGRNTRFFDIRVLTAQGDPVDSARVFSYQWFLNTHSAEQTANHTFYVRRRMAQQTGWAQMNLSGISQFNYGLLANRDGIAENGGTGSQCERVVDDRDALICPLSFEGRRANLAAQLPIYLSAPMDSDPIVASVESLYFQDDQGTNSISPDGDGIQDTATLSFEANSPGTLRLWLDLDASDTMNTESEMVLKVPFESGAQTIQWDGTDGDGNLIPPGDYTFSVHFSFAEFHLISVGLESLADGLRFATPRGVVQPTYWNDTSVFEVQAQTHLHTPWHDADPIRTWREEEHPVAQRPVLFDTWSNLFHIDREQANCVRLEEAFTQFRINPENEDGDNDLDGLSNNEEDVNGNGQIDPGETDPNDSDTDDDGLDDRIETEGEPSPVRSDTDQDGISDGVEDESGDGFYQDGETDPTDPDTDNDRLYDGQEDANGNGRVDPGETDPRIADTDGDGINDGDDPFPLDPESDGGVPDALIPLATNQGDAFGLGGDATMDIPNSNGYEEDGFLGCDCASHNTPQPTVYTLCLMLILVTLRRRVSA